jgi:CDP-diacylglycerol--serine O-phosphatidyltransferase
VRVNLRKSLFLLPNLITFSSVFCGFLAITLCGVGTSDKDFVRAALLIVYAMFFDTLDGRVARLTKTQSALGVQLDSLADVISFGVAPACLAYAVGMSGGWDAVALLYFVACGISRLARYNVTADSLAGARGRVTYFEGVPIPSSTLLVLLLVWLTWLGRIGPALPLGMVGLGPFVLHPLVLLFVLSGSLMISKTLRVPKP